MKYLCFSAFVALTHMAWAQMTPEKEIVVNSIEQKAGAYNETAHEIWNLAELGFLENESMTLLVGHLLEAGFAVDTGVAGMPTAFVGEWGSGEPVVGMLAEYDALPGMAQAAVPYPEPLKVGKAGHACGHHLFGTGSVAAAVAVKDWMQNNNISGTIRLYGTPAEEGGGAKVYMVREGLFDDVDAVLTWHPGDANGCSPASTLAAVGGVWTFKGRASHAAKAPERGRSALDGVEAMNHMVNLMREHIPDASRIHYSVKNGGGAPNVVPSSASVAYIIRHPDMEVVKDLLRRVNLAADGAALGTETTVSHDLETGYFNVMPNSVLAKVISDNLHLVGGVHYSEEERAFAKEIMQTYPHAGLTPESASHVNPFNPDPPVVSASTDVGDISWIVPTASMRAATWVPGTAPHSWQAVAAGGTEIGRKGMLVAAKSLALSAIDVFRNPQLIESAKAELVARRGEQFEYESLLGDREPPLNYRVNY